MVNIKFISTLLPTISFLIGYEQPFPSTFIKQKHYEGYIFTKEYPAASILYEDVKESFTPNEAVVIKLSPF